jgi:hypothetical protein
MIRRNLLNFESADAFGKFFYIHPNQALERVSNIKARLEPYQVKGASFQSIGQTLYSSHGNQYLARHEAIDVYREMMELFPKSAVFQPHDYMFFADHLFNFVMYNAQQAKFSDTVPFMSYVLAGYKPMFARYGNFFSNTQNELLRMIDYHLYPSFYLTHASAYLLLDTGSKDIYTSKYDIWANEVKRQYHYVNDALKHVIGAHIVSREVLSAGVNKVTYSNGVIIYINYSANDFEGIPANGYRLGGIL